MVPLYTRLYMTPVGHSRLIFAVRGLHGGYAAADAAARLQESCDALETFGCLQALMLFPRLRAPQMYCRPTEANQQAVCHIMRGGIRFACLDLPSRAEFLGYGLGHFIGRLSPENAAAVSAHLVKEAAPALKKAPEQLELVDNFNSHLEVPATRHPPPTPHTAGRSVRQ